MTGMWNGEHLLEALRAAARDLERHATSLNALNVFPVPNGNTVTNMALNFQARIDQNVQMMKAADLRAGITFDVPQDSDRRTPAKAPQDAYNVCHTLRRQGVGAAKIAMLYYSRGIDVARAEIPAEAIRAAFPALPN